MCERMRVVRKCVARPIRSVSLGHVADQTLLERQRAGATHHGWFDHVLRGQRQSLNTLAIREARILDDRTDDVTLLSGCHDPTIRLPAYGW